MPFIRECIITTLREDDSAHIVPMGVHETEKGLMLAPFKPSTTLDNLLQHGTAVINYTDDVRVYAGGLTNRHDWPTIPTEHIKGMRLENCLAHTEVEIYLIEEDDLRPRFYCTVVHEQMHKPFHGYNRAQSAVLELAILVSRLHMLPPEKIDAELEYLRIGMEKTAGDREQEAWGWLMDKLNEYRNNNEKQA